MLLFRHRRKSRAIRMLVRMIILMVLPAVFLIVGGQSFAQKEKQETFSSPTNAVQAMVDAMKAGNIARLQAVFGPAGKGLFSSGDEVEDRETREEFVKVYEEKNRLETVGKNKVVLHVGKDDWAWPIPIVKVGQRWRFDAEEGKKEILARRIGENELAAIQVCLAYVDAQREYARDHSTGGMMEYAQKLMSDPVKKDGLCWESKQGEKQSPLGPLVAKACRSSFSGAQQGDELQPYHGYLYKILKKQGRNAPGGAYDYVVDGKMIGGFALVAYPAHYGSSGVMTFIVNQDGVVFQKNLGKNTEKLAEAMTSFDPDKTWTKVP